MHSGSHKENILVWLCYQRVKKIIKMLWGGAALSFAYKCADSMHFVKLSP